MKPARILALFATLFSFQAMAADEFVLSAPPMQDAAADRATFKPIAAWLSEVTGHRIRYEQARNWPAYIRNMQSASYDILFDGSHLVGWRVERIEHTPVSRFPGELRYVVVTPVRDDAPRFLSELEGATVCSGSLPGLDALSLMNYFTGSWNPPRINPVRGFDTIFDSLISGQCVAAVLPLHVYRDLAEEASVPTKIIHTGTPLPGRTFSVSPRLPALLRDRIQAALLSEEAGEVLALLGEYHHRSLPMIAVDEEEYRGLSDSLTGLWGF